jgi:hypothetical protein
MTRRRAGFFLKVGGSVLAAGTAAALFLLSRPPAPDTGGGATAPAPAGAVDRLAAIALLDRQIDTVLAHFGIAAGAAKKRSYAIPEEHFTRTERLVGLPDTIAPVSVNAAMNAMARRYGGRAVAAENARLGTVTIHVELDGIVVHTVILRKVPVKPARDGRQPRPAT